MTGPYDTEADATAEPMPRAVSDLHGAGRVRSGDPERLVTTTVMGFVVEAMETAGVVLGDFDRKILAWLCSWEPAAVQVLLGLVARAHAAGVATPLVPLVEERLELARLWASLAEQVADGFYPLPADAVQTLTDRARDAAALMGELRTAERRGDHG